MKVICFGDSNTYGYDPRGYLGGRYDADCRWVDVLAAETWWTISNMGQNGREIPSAAEVIPEKGSTVLVYCRSENRSKTASSILAELCYTIIYEFGGINTWPYETEP